MPTITETANANAIWNGTVPFDADPDVTGFNLYQTQQGPNAEHFRRVTFVPKGAGPGTTTLGPLTYPRLFVTQPTRGFKLRATTVRTVGGETDRGSEPILEVSASAVIGWSKEQLLEQEMRPIMPVGFDPVNNLFYPICVEETSPGKFCLATNATATIAPGDIQIGAVEIKDHTTDDRARVKIIPGLAAGEFAMATYDAFNLTTTTSTSTGPAQLDSPSAVSARHLGSAYFIRTAGSGAIGLELGIRDGSSDFPIVNISGFVGNSSTLIDIHLDAASNLYAKTTGAIAGDDFAVKFINKIFP